MVLKKFIKNKELINTVLLGLVVATIPFKNNFGNITLLLAFSYNIIFFSKKNINRLKSFAFIFPVFIFLIALVSSALSKDSYGIRRLDLEALSVVVAIILVNQDYSRDKLVTLLKWFFYASAFSVIILLVKNGINFIIHRDFNSIVFHEFTSLYDQHPVFYSIYLSLALFFSTYNNLIKNKLQQVFLNLALIIGIILCASKAVIVFDLLAFAIFYFFKSNTISKKVGFVFGILLLAFLIVKVPFINNRFKDGLRFKESILLFQPTNDFSKKKNFTYEEKTNISDLELRYILGKIGMYHLVKDKKIYFGYGKGDSRGYLNYYLMSYSLAPNWYENFNLHNQYLDILFTSGIFVLILFLIYLCYSFVIVVKSKNKAHLFYLMLISFVFIFDSPLSINKGIVFFYFFNTLFLFNYLTIENSNIRN